MEKPSTPTVDNQDVDRQTQPRRSPRKNKSMSNKNQQQFQAIVNLHRDYGITSFVVNLHFLCRNKGIKKGSDLFLFQRRPKKETIQKIGNHLIHKDNLTDIKKWMRDWRYKLFKHFEEKAKELVRERRTTDLDIQQATETNINHVASFYAEGVSVR